MKEQRIKLIGKLLHQQGNTARAFVQYMDSDREYTAGDKLYMREAHFVIAIGPGCQRDECYTGGSFADRITSGEERIRLSQEE